MSSPASAFGRTLPALLVLWICALPALAQSSASQPASQPSDPALTGRRGIDTGPAPDTSSSIPWLEAIKQPLPWIKFGGDLRMREHYANNYMYLDSNRPTHDQHFQRYRTRIWSQVTPIENVEINARVTWEFYNFCEPASVADSRRDTNPDEVVFDTLNVKWKKTFDLDNTLTIGRQDIMDLGTGWLVMDGTPLDGSRTFYFDAIRDTYEIKDAKTTVDLIYINQESKEDNRIIYPFNSQQKYIEEENASGVIAWVKNKSLEKTQLDGYFIYKNDDDAHDYPNGVTGEIYTVGGLVQHEFDKHWKVRGEYAEQFGHKDGEHLSARGANTRLTYNFLDEWKQEARLGYEYLSGDGDPTKNFDPLWGRWPQWSELMPYVYVPETGIGYITNLHRLNLGWTAKPAKPIELLADYNLLFADEPYDNKAGFSSSNCFRGQLVSAVLRYKFNQYISGHLLGEVFFPGDFYDHQSTAVFLRYELTITW